jgi:hypothetical protein
VGDQITCKITGSKRAVILMVNNSLESYCATGRKMLYEPTASFHKSFVFVITHCEMSLRWDANNNNNNNNANNEETQCSKNIKATSEIFL